MKKIFVLLAFLTTVGIAGANAQGPGGGDPEAAKQQYVERTKPKLMEKTKLTDAQATKVMDIRFSYMGRMRGLRDMSQEERQATMEQIRAAQDKEMSAIPLTPEQIKAVNDFFDEQRKEMMKNRGNNAGN